jgi:hypothetical protein
VRATWYTGSLAVVVVESAVELLLVRARGSRAHAYMPAPSAASAVVQKVAGLQKLIAGHLSA